MKNGKRVTEMNDREYRLYKRNLRRQREMKRRLRLLAVTFCLVVIGAFSYCSFKSSANTGDDLSFKYYKAITVQSGDTLWNIADEYIDYGRYKDKSAYISEVMNINHLEDASEIISGQKLTVPYFSSEYVH